MKRVLVFGVFDLLHPGHVYFLQESAKKGDGLIVVVARDSAVRELKKIRPVHSEKQRLGLLRKLPFVMKAVLGDAARGTYGVLQKYRPSVICFGYDQHDLLQDVGKRMKNKAVPIARLVRIRPFQPRTFKTSILKKAKNVI